MKVNRSSSSNLKFLYGSVFFFAVLILTMLLFVYYAMGEASKNTGQQMFSYTVFFADDFDAGTCKVILDDSLLCAAESSAPGKSLVVTRRTLRDAVPVDGRTEVHERVLFSSESLLQVIDTASGDTVAVVVGENSRIGISRLDGKVKVSLSEQ